MAYPVGDGSSCSSFLAKDRKRKREVSLITESKDHVYAKGTRGQASAFSEKWPYRKGNAHLRKVFPLINTDQQNIQNSAATCICINNNFLPTVDTIT